MRIPVDGLQATEPMAINSSFAKALFTWAEARLSAVTRGTGKRTREPETMRILRLLCRSAIAAGAMALTTGLQIAPASAQLFWDWGGGSTVGGSGREVVSFSPQYNKGQIIVSFGDRRLYYITQPGQAFSYPIAIPREQSRWQGVTSVSDKRVNPSWTPTPTMMAENPRLPRWVPGGHPMNPLGCAPCTWAPAPIAFTAPTPPGRLVRRCRRAASACTIRMCSTFIRACRWAPKSR